jgi:hypothetical protein
MIIESSPGHVLLEVKGKRVIIWGYVDNHVLGNLTFVATWKDLDFWNDGAILTDSDREIIKTTLNEDFVSKGWAIEWVGLPPKP